MRALSLLLLTLLAGPALAQDSATPTGCKEDNSDCREDCTVEYGSSSRTYSKLGSCLQQCKTKYDSCRERHIVLQERENLNLEPIPAAPVATPAPREVSKHAAPLPENDPADDLAAATDGRSRDVYRASPEEPKPAAPAPASPSPKSPPAEGTVRRDVYRTSTPEPESFPEPAKAPEPKAVAKPEPVKPEPAKTVSAEPDPLNDGVPPPAPPPPPKPKPVDPPRPKPPPEPKKDISDWDPNGD